MKKHRVHIGKFLNYICHHCQMNWRMELNHSNSIPSENDVIFCPYCGKSGTVKIESCIGFCCEQNFKYCPRREEILEKIENNK